MKNLTESGKRRKGENPIIALITMGVFVLFGTVILAVPLYLCSFASSFLMFIPLYTIGIVIDVGLIMLMMLVLTHNKEIKYEKPNAS